jgi:hypothetical protein
LGATSPFAATGISPLSAVRVAGRHARLIRIEFESDGARELSEFRFDIARVDDRAHP